MKKLLLLVLLSISFGCATSPENIPPSYISDIPYRGWECDQLAEEQIRLNAALSTAYGAQRKARSNDITGVILIGLPVSSMSGENMSHEVGRLKGEMQALQRAAIIKRCNLSPLAIVEPPKAQPRPEPATND